MKYKPVLFILALLALLTIPGHADSPRSCPPPQLIGALSFAGATEGVRLSGDRATSLAVEGKLRIQNALG